MNNLMVIPLGMRLVFVGDIDYSVTQCGCRQCASWHHWFTEDTCYTTDTHLPTGAIQSYCNECPCTINRGAFPDLSNGKDTDFFYQKWWCRTGSYQHCTKLVKNRLPKAYGMPTNKIQVLTPMQRGVVGASIWISYCKELSIQADERTVAVILSSRWSWRYRFATITIRMCSMVTGIFRMWIWKSAPWWQISTERW